MNDKLENNSEPSPSNDERVSAYLDGALSDAELVDFENLLRDNAEYRSAVEEMRQVSEAVRALPRLALDAGFSERVMLEAHQATGSVSHSSAVDLAPSVVPAAKRSKSGWRSFVYVAATLAAALLLMALSGYNPFSKGNLAKRDVPMDGATFAVPEDDATDRAVPGMTARRRSFQLKEGWGSKVDDKVNGEARLDGVYDDGLTRSVKDNGSKAALRSETATPSESSQRREGKLIEEAIPEDESDALGIDEPTAKSKSVESLYLAPLQMRSAAPPSAIPAAPLPPSATADSIAADDRTDLRMKLPQKKDGNVAAGTDKISGRLHAVPTPSDPFADPQTLNTDESVLGQDFTVPDRSLVRFAEVAEADRHAEFINTRLAENETPAIDQVAVVSLPAKANIDFFFAKAEENGIRRLGLRRIGKGQDAVDFGTRKKGIDGGNWRGVGGGATGGAVAAGNANGVAVREAQPYAGGYGGGGAGFGDVSSRGRVEGSDAFGIELEELKERELKPKAEGLEQDAAKPSGLDLAGDLDGFGVVPRGAQTPPDRDWAKLPAAVPGSPAASSSEVQGRAYYFGNSSTESGDEKTIVEQVEKAGASDMHLYLDPVGRSNVEKAERLMRESTVATDVAFGRQQGRFEHGEYVLVEAPADVMLSFVKSLDAKPNAVWHAARIGSLDDNDNDNDNDGDGVELDDVVDALGNEIEDLGVASPQKQSANASAVPDTEEDESQAIAAKPTDELSATLRRVPLPEAKLSKLQSELQRPFSVKRVPSRNQLYSALGFRKEDKTKIEPGKPVSILFYLAPPAEAAALEAITSEAATLKAAVDAEVAPATEVAPAAVPQP